MTTRTTPEISRRKTRDRSAALVIVGAVLLLPPFAGSSIVDLPIAGLPMPLVYVFSVWLALIVGAALLARPLGDADTPGGPVDQPETDS